MNKNNNNSEPSEIPGHADTSHADSHQIGSQSQPATKKNRIIKTSLIVLGVIIAIVAVLTIGFFAVIYIGFSGGIKGVWLDTQTAPNVNSSSINKTRQNVDSTAKSKLQNISSSIGAEEFAVSTVDSCEKGQHNYKVSDSYAYRCNHRVTKFYGLNGEIVSNLSKLSKQLADQGWEATDSGSIEEYIADYQANLTANKKLNPDGSNPYSISRTPAIIRYKNDSYQLTVDFIDANTNKKDLYKIEALTTTSPRYDNIIVQNDSFSVVKSSQAILQKYPYVLVLSVSNEYYKK